VAKIELEELAAAIARHTLVDGAHQTAVPPLRLSRYSEPSELAAVVYEPCLCVVAQGAKELSLEGEAYRYDPAQSLLVSVDLPASARVAEATSDRPCLMVRIALDMAAVGELLAGDLPTPPPGPARGLGLCPLEAPLCDAVIRLVTLLDAPHDIGPLYPLVLREITYRVLTGPHGKRLRQIASTGVPAQRIARAIRYLKDHFAEPLSIKALAKEVRLGASAFHSHFKTVTALSPLQYQKRLRLQEARRLLLGDGLDAAEAAYRVGYESPSQFSREYRRLFGMPPRQDVAGSKGEAQLVSQSGA
jgi:AraC-like DNA-binding protein